MVVSLNSRLESNKEEEEGTLNWSSFHLLVLFRLSIGKEFQGLRLIPGLKLSPKSFRV